MSILVLELVMGVLWTSRTCFGCLQLAGQRLCSSRACSVCADHPSYRRMGLLCSSLCCITCWLCVVSRADAWNLPADLPPPQAHRQQAHPSSVGSPDASQAGLDRRQHAGAAHVPASACLLHPVGAELRLHASEGCTEPVGRLPGALLRLHPQGQPSAHR